MAASAFTVYVDQLLDEINAGDVEARFGYKFSAATVAATSLTTTDPNIVKLGANYDSQRFNGKHVYLVTNTEQRMITNMTITSGTATLNFVGANATVVSTASDVYLLFVSWSELRALFNDALNLEHAERFYYLRHGPDSADMQGSAVDTDWTESGASDTVQTTAAEVAFGAQSFVVVAAGAGDYTQSGLNNIGQGTRVQLHGVVKADIGTGILRALDGSGNVQDSIQTTQEHWVYLGKEVQFDVTDEQLRLRLVESAASDAGDWNLAAFVRLDESNFRLPSWIDNRYKVRYLARTVFHKQGEEADTWLYESREEVTLREGWDQDYRFIKRPGDANPYMIWVDKKYLSDLLCLVVDEPYSATYGVGATFTTDATTNTCDVLQLVARAKKLIAERYKPTFAEWLPMATSEISQRAALRETDKPKEQIQIRRFFG